MSLSITFSGEASEGFADWVGQRKGWYVQITPLEDEGDQFDAVLIGSGTDWYDAVSFQRADPDTGLALEGAPVETIRVQNVYVY